MARGLLCHANPERTQKLWHWLAAVVSFLDGELELCELHLAKGQQDVILAREVVKKRAFADVRRLRDIFDGRLCKAFPSKEIQSRAEQALAGFYGAAFATAAEIAGRRACERFEVSGLALLTIIHK